MRGFRPLKDRVVIRRADKEQVSAGGIIIPDKAQKRTMEGEVIAVGPGKMLEDGTVRPVDVKKGDRVAFGRYGGNEKKVENQELLILKEDDILGVFEN